MAQKKTMSVAEQLRRGMEGHEKWRSGELKLRTTIVERSGQSHTAAMTKSELDVRMLKAKFIRSLRSQVGMSQPEFASLIHVSPAALRQWETTRRAIPDNVLALASLAATMPSVRIRLETMDLNSVVPA
jgi:DNA-binding transcriptional regulator YiaG